jgi:glycolate oxidase FAD binding subunit
LRTLPIPQQRRGLWLRGPADQLATLARWLLDSSLSPERIDWQQTPSPNVPSSGLLLCLASISAQTLEEQIACVRERAPGLVVDDLDAIGLNQHLGSGLGNRSSAGPEQTPPGWLLRLGVRPAQLETLLQERALAPIAWSFVAGSGLGMAWADADQLAGHQVEQLRRRCGELGGYLTVLRQPAGNTIPAWLDAPSRPVIEAIKRQFDPKQQLARGRLPGVQPQPQLPN